ncbi:YheU family protein [Marinomonas piezotolerans]|uniref:YheU family protein n=1 Tax=Marinomonas piezotolerans TaxID=2213058 RepID=A0A370U763_9GAMM|nr:YheU family protein [Marinomonas piezotolerans]RDL43620.1 YheU family protein [Marinomonas piezotolerans]
MDTLIPHDTLDPETLENVLNDIVTRDGTDYGEYDLSLEQKRLQALKSLHSGEAVLVFDTESETIQLISKQSIQQRY